MQKFYLKHKDKWWTVPLALFSAWLVGKGLDYIWQIIQQNGTDYYINKISTLLQYKISILSVLSALLGTFTSFLSYTTFQHYKVGTRKLKILKALYGKNFSWLDITNELNSAVSNDQLAIVLSNNIAGDPIPGHQKMGRITYEYNGQTFMKDYIEGQTILLP